VPGLPTITNLKTIAFWGTGDDGIEGNRVAGGPSIIVSDGSPVYDTNQVNLGVQSGPRNDVLDSQVPRDAQALAGVTWCAAARISHVTPGTGSRGEIFGDFKTGGTGIAASWSCYVTGQSNAQLAPGNTVRASIAQVISPITNFHFYAMTYTGGAAGTFTLYDFTENNSTGVPVTYVASGQATGTQSVHWGNRSGENLASQPIEHSFGLIANSVISQSDLAKVYSWAKANLLRRGITI
jgi:hypothetical protein